MRSKENQFYDELSEKLYPEIEWRTNYPQSHSSRVMVELSAL